MKLEPKTEVEKVEKTRPTAVKSGDVVRPYESGINPPPSPKFCDLQGITPPPAPVFPKRESLPKPPIGPPPDHLLAPDSSPHVPKVIPATRDIPPELRVLLPAPPELLARPPIGPPPDHLLVDLPKPPNMPPPQHLLAAPDSSSTNVSLDGATPPWRDPLRKRKWSY